jgi:hypothetical protein
MLENKDNIINFPVERRMAEIDKEAAREEFYLNSNNYDDCVELARYCVDLLQTGIQEQDFIEFDPTKDPQQFTDMFIILNLLVASFLRSADIKHILQEDLDELLTKIQILERTDDTT